MKAELRPTSEMKDSGKEYLDIIPVDWRINRGKTILRPLNRPLLENDGVVTCFRDGEVTLRSNRRTEGFTNAEKEIGYQGVEPGDLVVHGMDGFAGAIGVSDSRGKMSPIINVLDSKENKRFLMYYLRATAYREVFLALSTGIRERSCDLRWNKLATFPFLIPARKEQQVIVEYLDDRCSRIDEIIVEATASIEEYKEMKQAVIFEAVTKGLDKHVSLQDSGIPWIGCIPSSWQITKLGRYVNILPGYAFSSSDFASEGIPLLRGINVTPDGLRWDETVYWNNDTIFLSQFYLKEGDIVVGLDRPWIKEGMRAWIIEGSDLPCLLLQRVCRIRCSNNVLNSFVFYWLRSKIFEDALVADTTGISVPHISSNQIAEFKMAFPKIDEQLRIVKYLDEQMRSINELIKEKQSLIEDLQSYKKSLIYEVVTGKRRVV